MLVVTAALVMISLPSIRSESPGPSATTTAVTPPALPPISIIFAANSSSEVGSLVGKVAAYVEPGDAFDLVTGNPNGTKFNVSSVNAWASELRSVYPYPAYPIYAHTAGLANYRVLAGNVSSNVTGLFYDYEPNYESEFTGNFSKTLGYFEDATKIAEAHGHTSVGYPTGKPIELAEFAADNWSYGELAETVGQLVIQTQTYCRSGTSQFAAATEKVLNQYLGVGDRSLPTFQVTLGINRNETPNQVTTLQAYNCTQVLTGEGLTTLYLWWGPGSSSHVIQFLKDIGRKAHAT